MKKHAVEIGVVLVILLVGFLARPSGQHLTELTAAALHEKAEAGSRHMKDAWHLVALAPPRLAAYVSNVLLGLATIVGGLAIYAAVATPVQVHLLHRKISRVEDQLGEITADLNEVSRLLAEMIQRLPVMQGIEQDAFVAKPPLTGFMLKRNPKPTQN